MKQHSGETLYKEKKSFKELLKDQRVLLIIAIIAIAIVVGFINSRFFLVDNVISIFQSACVSGVLTLAMAMLLLNGGLDLSIGNMTAMICIIMSVLLRGGTGTTAPTYEYSFDIDVDQINATTGGLPLLPVILIAFGIAIGCGFINGLIVSKSKCMPLIITLGLSNVYYGIALIISEGKYLSMDDAFEPFRMLKIGGVLPVMLLVFIALVIFSWWLIGRTKYGRRVIAVGGNEEMARLSGIAVDKNKITTYTISGAFVAVAAILYATKLNSVSASAGSDYALTALSGAVIGGVTFDGGKGTIIGAFIGCMLMSVIDNAMNICGVDAYVKIIINGAIVVGAVVMSNIENLRRK